MYSETVAKLLVDIGAATARLDQPYVFTSGMRSPIYCDTRLLISFPKERSLVVNSLCELIRYVAPQSWNVVAGVATAGIPFAAWIAAEFDKPMVYVREATKGHGKKLRIEGRVIDGQGAIVVEDLFTTGHSALAVVEALREHGAVCETCVAVVDYGFRRASALFRQRNVQHYSLTTIPAVVEMLRAQGKTTDLETQAIIEWHRQENE